MKKFTVFVKQLKEEVAANAVGDGSKVAGLDNDPPVKKKQKLVRRSDNVKRRNMGT